nr:hypothetical protein [Alcaligenes faecalis]
MPAHNSEFPWLSYYKNYNFFEQRMREHSKVSGLKLISTGLYKITLTSNSVLKVFICECYAFDDAAYYELIDNYGKVDAVVISSNWCSYNFETKLERMREKVGIFDIRGFMAAINKPNYWEYMTEYEREKMNHTQ